MQYYLLVPFIATTCTWICLRNWRDELDTLICVRLYRGFSIIFGENSFSNYSRRLEAARTASPQGRIDSFLLAPNSLETERTRIIASKEWASITSLFRKNKQSEVRKFLHSVRTCVFLPVLRKIYSRITFGESQTWFLGDKLIKVLIFTESNSRYILKRTLKFTHWFLLAFSLFAFPMIYAIHKSYICNGASHGAYICFHHF